jgi:hypothetical protein
MTVGTSAEFIIENTSPQLTPPSTAFTDFSPTVRMTGSALSSQTGRYSQNISTDATVFLLTDFTNTTTRINVALGPPDATCFTISQPSNPLPRVRCARFFPPPPRPSQIDTSRKDEIVALILFGVIQDAGGVAIVGGKAVPIPPRGPVREILSALPPALAEQLAPLVKTYPPDAEAANSVVERLTSVITRYVQEQLSQHQQPATQLP